MIAAQQIFAGRSAELRHAAETPDRKMLQGDQPVNRPDAHC